MANLIKVWTNAEGREFESVIGCEDKCLNMNVLSCKCEPMLKVRRRLREFEDIGYEPEEVLKLLDDAKRLREIEIEVVKYLVKRGMKQEIENNKDRERG